MIAGIARANAKATLADSLLESSWSFREKKYATTSGTNKATAVNLKSTAILKAQISKIRNLLECDKECIEFIVILAPRRYTRKQIRINGLSTCKKLLK